jgi:hypothetical protein
MIESKRSRRVAVVGALVTLVVVIVLGAVSGGERLVSGTPGAAGSAVTGVLAEPSTGPAPAADTPVSGLSFEEELYLRVLDEGGISYSTERAAVAAGHSICEFLAAGGTWVQAADIAMDSGGYSAHDSGYIVGAATGSLCGGL